jgi:hypothetical protein
MEQPDWRGWHGAYDDESSSLSDRLRLVRTFIRHVLDARNGRPTRVISACAGEGRDIIAATATHPARRSVEALLVEITPAVAATARESARRHGLERFTVMEADAGRSDVYASMVPANLLLFCGIFGWISDEDVFRTIAFLPRLAAPGATVIWTRHHREPDLTGAARARFAAAGFEEIAFVKPENSVSSVGVHRLAVPPLEFERGAALFTFARSTAP